MSRQHAGKLLCTLLAAALAASAVSTKPANSPPPRPTDAKQRVLDLEQQWIAAENKHDAAVLERILDDRFLSTFGANQPRDKAAFIKALTAGDVDPTQAQTLSDETVILDRDTAVVIGTDSISGTKDGTAFKRDYRYTITYIHRNGHWLALAEHLVAVPQPK